MLETAIATLVAALAAALTRALTELNKGATLEESYAIAIEVLEDARAKAKFKNYHP